MVFAFHRQIAFVASFSEDNGTLEINAPLGWTARLIFLAAALMCFLLPGYELRQAFLQPGWWSLFPAIIVLGAWSVGTAFFLGFIAGESLHWEIKDGTLTLHRASPASRRVQVITGADVGEIAVRTVKWDSGADTYCVSLRLNSGERIDTPEFKTRAEAEELAAEIRGRLSISPH